MTNPGSTTARGYGADHQRIRARWARIVRAGDAECHAKTCLHPTRHITPDEPWDLGHNQTRTAWAGPEHRTCNRTEGAIRRNHPTAFTTSRNW